MIRIFLHLCFYIILFGITYVCMLYYFPDTGRYVDEKLGKTWNQELQDMLLGWIHESEIIKNRVDKKIGNPLPEVTNNIKGRMGE